MGNGLFYRISLFDASAVVSFDTSNDSEGNTTLELFKVMDAGGIPSQLVPIGDGQLVRSDLKIEETDARMTAKTYWYETYRQ